VCDFSRYEPTDGPQIVSMINWFWRIAYRISFRAARLWWWLRRPDHHGAVVAIWFDERILIVQQSYRTNLSWPGGSL
jgi:8-oxo-dGTP diphosphatase